MNATEQELINLEEFGQTMADSVVEFFKEEKNISVIEKLKEAGVNTKLIFLPLLFRLILYLIHL